MSGGPGPDFPTLPGDPFGAPGTKRYTLDRGSAAGGTCTGRAGHGMTFEGQQAFQLTPVRRRLPQTFRRNLHVTLHDHGSESVRACSTNWPGTLGGFLPSAPGLTGFLNGGLGVSGATIPGLAAIPSACVGATVAACKSALTSAGFTATPTVTTLSTAAADLTKPAGNVVTTTLAPNTQVDTATVGRSRRTRIRFRWRSRTPWRTRLTRRISHGYRRSGSRASLPRSICLTWLPILLERRARRSVPPRSPVLRSLRVP